MSFVSLPPHLAQPPLISFFSHPPSVHIWVYFSFSSLLSLVKRRRRWRARGLCLLSLRAWSTPPTSPPLPAPSQPPLRPLPVKKPFSPRLHLRRTNVRLRDLRNNGTPSMDSILSFRPFSLVSHFRSLIVWEHPVFLSHPMCSCGLTQALNSVWALLRGPTVRSVLPCPWHLRRV